ncbi:MAG: hypothetical protein SGJ02_12915 [bacterium]|nr:hypothetical protein [bacterium]
MSNHSHFTLKSVATETISAIRQFSYESDSAFRNLTFGTIAAIAMPSMNIHQHHHQSTVLITNHL